MRSSVLPEPAGACTMNERVGSSARSRSSRSGTMAASFIGFALAFRTRVERRLFGDAAKGVLVAGLARIRQRLRVDARIALRERAPQRFQLHAPAGHELLPVAVAPGRLAPVLVDGDDARDEVGHARD